MTIGKQPPHPPHPPSFPAPLCLYYGGVRVMEFFKQINKHSAGAKRSELRDRTVCLLFVSLFLFFVP